ncbi:cytochrome ubiquinol oxidase subunit I [Planobispora takensis]|uniref:Cytochrome ubiquinol oxidase subunit I n=1 Tax=Planobispora takensis TaxID=1367882 RepID=A0A8J3WUK4_9ACTN|nr:cytochrome ubiquinol oxidase subunit I [Planobispora takensis]GII02786.1 cytochrome ubiquinol oxidase subunit I [Planobispora takensis]
MDAEILARVQFAVTVGFHWLFVLLTLGLAPLVAYMQARHVFGGNPRFERMTRFWGQIYVVNYVLGIATGLVMEFQFGLSWSGLSVFAGNVFGAPLAMETLVAFFAESTFLGLWIFGWGRLPKVVHMLLFWLVTLTAYASAYWILVANGFMHHPVGHEVRGGVAYLTDFSAMLTNPNALYAMWHVVSAALVAGGGFVAGVSAYQFIRRTHEVPFFLSSARAGLALAAPFSIAVAETGFRQIPPLHEAQPMKTAALREVLLPEDRGTDTVAQVQAAMAERLGPGDYAPPGWITGAYDVMMTSAFFIVVISLLGAAFLIRDVLARSRAAALVVVLIVPIPFVAATLGWLVREVGRQPWAVYGELLTSQARSPAGPGTMLASLIGFSTLLGALAITNWCLIARYARRGPRDTDLGTPAAATPEGPVVAVRL